MNENNNDDTTTRGDIEADIVQQIQNEIQEAILLHAPESWPHEQCEAVEESVLDHTRLVLSALSRKELQSEGALRMHIAQAVADAKRIIHQGGVRRTNS